MLVKWGSSKNWGLNGHFVSWGRSNGSMEMESSPHFWWDKPKDIDVFCLNIGYPQKNWWLISLIIIFPNKKAPPFFGFSPYFSDHPISRQHTFQVGPHPTKAMGVPQPQKLDGYGKNMENPSKNGWWLMSSLKFIMDNSIYKKKKIEKIRR